MSHQRRCILYSANGARYVAESIAASAVTGRHCDDTPVVLHSDRPVRHEHVAFDRVVPRDKTKLEERHRFLFRLNSLLLTTYNENLYLDTDAALVQRESEGLFRLLERFDIAVAHAPTRTLGKPNAAIPSSFPEFNAGVILFRKTKAVEEVFETWRDLYVSGELHHPHDQGALRHALYFSDLRIATLPPEYNNRDKLKRQCIIWHNRRLFL